MPQPPKINNFWTKYLQGGFFRETLYQCHQTIATKVTLSLIHLIDQTWLRCCHGSVKTQDVNTRFHFSRCSVAVSHKLSHLNLLCLWNHIHSISYEIDVGYWELKSFPGITY